MMQTQVFNLVKMTDKKSLKKPLHYGWHGKGVDQ